MIAIKMIQFITGIKAFHQKSENHDCGVQASIPSSSIIQILILSTPWTWK